MGDYKKCKNCGEFAFLKGHTCRPEWEVISFEQNDKNQPKRSFGFEANEAAEKYAEQNFSRWDYPEEMEIWVRKPNMEWQKFDVSVEFIPSFTASIIPDNNP